MRKNNYLELVCMIAGFGLGILLSLVLKWGILLGILATASFTILGERLYSLLTRPEVKKPFMNDVGY
ncbi:hypothetical protein [Polymorphum gilvum]|uniref:hypothetical protein n=1 Tax=Polymorphum gilvum TaxID=991904 RepID=UPI0002DE916A|nr:hypothetical protein [Polymorphum gilvum]